MFGQFFTTKEFLKENGRAHQNFWNSLYVNSDEETSLCCSFSMNAWREGLGNALERGDCSDDHFVRTTYSIGINAWLL